MKRTTVPVVCHQPTQHSSPPTQEQLTHSSGHHPGEGIMYQ